ncbi:major facilitator superfamily domain-containing protein [Xylariales sp. PMI_506]|nr:major facilitator superfamily domain-containing protein [Xylariales sp. PMI_506]
MTVVLLVLHVPTTTNEDSLRHKLKQMNIECLIALVPGVVCLCLALQWGGFSYSWNDGRIIALLVVAFIPLIAFVLIQIWRPDRATVPPHLFVQRSIASAFFLGFCIGAHQALYLYYLPVWFQTTKGDSAVESGIHLLPQLIALVVSSIGSGILTSRIGYYTLFLIIGICATAVGAGLLTTLDVGSSVGQWIGYQIIYGWGFGFCVQVSNMAAQTVLPREQVAIGVSLMLFAQTLSGAIFVSIGQNVFDGQLARRLSGIMGITTQQIENI